MTSSHNRITGLPGESDLEKYRIAKRTLVVGVRKTLKFDTSKPSAEYAIPLSTGCTGHCHYCYLQTTLGNRPYIRVYVNLDEIFAAAKQYIREREPEITHFEAACTSDPVSLEPITGTLKKTIEFMAGEEFGRLRFVTKFDTVDTLLDARHNGHTRIRFSVNADYVIKNFEPATASFRDRIIAASKVAKAGYPMGFIVAPLILFDGWEEGYRDLFRNLKESMPAKVEDMSFELISHRFTTTAKSVILKRYPKSKLEMDEAQRKYKWGRYGRGKYMYPPDQLSRLREYLEQMIGEYFPEARLEYFT